MSKTLSIKNGMIEINPSGQVVMVDSITKANQDMAWMLMQNYDPVTGSGSELYKVDFPVQATKLAASGLITKRIYETVDRLKKLQWPDRDKIGDDEMLDNITSLIVVPQGSMKFAFILKVAVKSGDTLLASKQIYLAQQLPKQQLFTTEEEREMI